MKIRRNDVVTVIAGDEKGKSGKILRLVDGGRVLIEGVNLVWKHLRRSQQHPHGARIQKEAPLHVSNVAVLSPADNKPTKIGYQVLPNGSKVRICRRSKQPIPEPKG